MKQILLFLSRLCWNLTKLFFICVPLEFLGIVILFFTLPLVRKFKSKLTLKQSCRDNIKLPMFLRWFDNADIYVGRDYSTYYKVYIGPYWDWYYWLSIRNPLNYFGYKVLGKRIYPGAWKIHIGNQMVDDRVISGFFYGEIQNVYTYYYVHKWNSTKCLRFRMGWKLTDNFDDNPVQWVMTIQPWKDYNGV